MGSGKEQMKVSFHLHMDTTNTLYKQLLKETWELRLQYFIDEKD